MSRKNALDLPALHDAPVSPALAVGSVALSLALQWFDISVVKDGAMYQQLKLEGKKIEGVDLTNVLEVAKQFELHLMGTSDRLANLVIEAVADGIRLEHPCHPGEILKEDILPDRDIPVEDAAGRMEMSIEDFEKILDGKAPVTQDFADKFEAAFDYPAHLLIGMQEAYDKAEKPSTETADHLAKFHSLGNGLGDDI